MSTRADEPDGLATVASLGERAIIERIRQRFGAAPHPLHVGIGDDAAVVAPLRGTFDVLTTDALVEGVHFDTAFSSYSDIGFKALAVNVSDVAAMGGTPRLALLSLVLPEGLLSASLDDVLEGFAAMAAEARTTLAGGNITRSRGGLIVDVTVVGSVRPRRVLRRSGGRPGDALYVTGSVGGAGAGLDWLRSQPAGRGRVAEPEDPGLRECVRMHRRPSPRLRLGAVAGSTRAAIACMDLSDGLADAVRQIAEQSGTGAIIDAASVPVFPPAAGWYESQGHDPLLRAMTAGDDYELLFVVPRKSGGPLRNLLRHARGVPVTRIGELREGSGAVLRRGSVEEPVPEGFAHF